MATWEHTNRLCLAISTYSHWVVFPAWMEAPFLLSPFFSLSSPTQLPAPFYQGRRVRECIWRMGMEGIPVLGQVYVKVWKRHSLFQGPVVATAGKWQGCLSLACVMWRPPHRTWRWGGGSGSRTRRALLEHGCALCPGMGHCWTRSSGLSLFYPSCFS